MCASAFYCTYAIPLATIAAGGIASILRSPLRACSMNPLSWSRALRGSPGQTRHLASLALPWCGGYRTVGSERHLIVCSQGVAWRWQQCIVSPCTVLDEMGIAQ